MGGGDRRREGEGASVENLKNSRAMLSFIFIGLRDVKFFLGLEEQKFLSQSLSVPIGG